MTDGPGQSPRVRGGEGGGGGLETKKAKHEIK